MTKTYAELQPDYLIVQSNTSRDRKHRLYRRSVGQGLRGLRFVGASADLKKLVAMANEDDAYVTGVQQAEG